ncbi:DUF1641 domain-containing protein [Oceanithermus sp.]
MPTVEERLERIERILDDSGIGFLSEIKLGPTVIENLSLLMEPKNLRLLSILDRFVEQADALEKLATALEKMDKSGVLELAGDVSETVMSNLSLLFEPKNLRLLSHLGNLIDILSGIDPTAMGMVIEAGSKAISETFDEEVIKNPPKVSMVGLLAQLKDPEIQQALGILFLLLRVLPRTMKNLKGEMDEIQAIMDKMMKK